MELKKYLGCSRAARKLQPADLVLKNARIVNVFTDRVEEGTVMPADPFAGLMVDDIPWLGIELGKQELPDTDIADEADAGRVLLAGDLDAPFPCHLAYRALVRDICDTALDHYRHLGG